MKPGDMGVEDAREQLDFQREAGVTGLSSELEGEGPGLGLSGALGTKEQAVGALIDEGQQAPGADEGARRQRGRVYRGGNLQGGISKRESETKRGGS
jgi:hypothetical protein